MPRKAFQLQVELEIQAVTCPGVWLCPNGKVSLQLYMLDSCIQTTSVPPAFPLLCHEKFIFYKIFYNAYRLSDLQKFLGKEILYAELIQWQNCEIGNVLATFETNLSDLLYPQMREGAIAGVDVDLLMEPEKHFPGIIAPKIEVNTKTTIEEKCIRDESKASNAFVVNPKVITSKGGEKSPAHFRQRKVCHSTGYHRKTHGHKTKGAKPPFIVRKVQDDLLTRKPQGLDHDSDPCHCMSRAKSLTRLNFGTGNESYYPDRVVVALPKKHGIPSKKVGCRYKSKVATPMCVCNCGHRHTQVTCPVCSKYKHYFSSNYGDDTSAVTKIDANDKVFKVCPNSKKLCCCSKINEIEGPPCLTGAKECDCPGSTSGKLCFCLPQKKPSLAEKLHERLTKTLGSCIDSLDDRDCRGQSLSTIYEQNCPPDVECRCGNCSSTDVFENFDKFYKTLYRSSKCCRSAESSNRYTTSCY